MSLMNRMMTLTVVLTALLGTQAAQAVSIAKFDLGAPVVTPGQAAIDVLLEFISDAPTDEISVLAVSVHGSDLTQSDTNFSRFSFVRDQVIADWDLLGDSLGGDGVQTQLVFSNGTPLTPGLYTLGQILINLNGLPTGQFVTVTLGGGDVLMATNTDVAGNVLINGSPADILSFSTDDGQDDVAFVQFGGDATFVTLDSGQVIPEPASAALGALSILGLAWATRRRR